MTDHTTQGSVLEELQPELRAVVASIGECQSASVSKQQFLVELSERCPDLKSLSSDLQHTGNDNSERNSWVLTKYLGTLLRVANGPTGRAVLAVAAATCLIALSLFHFTSSAWAQVQQAIASATSVQFVLTEVFGDAKPQDTVVTLEQPGLKFRLDRPDGSYEVGDLNSGRVVQFFPEKKRAVIIEGVPIPKDFNIVQRLQAVVATSEPVSGESPDRVIEGKKMERYRFKEETGDYQLWIDSESKLPVRVKLLSRSSTDGTTMHIQEDFHDFKYDLPKSSLDFSAQIPSDFVVETHKPPQQQTLEKANGEAELAADSQRSTVMAIQPGTGVGELRLGMQFDEVRTKLGAPDFFQDKLVHKLPNGVQVKQGAIMHFRGLGLALRFEFEGKLENIHMFAKDSPTMLARQSVKPASDFRGKLENGIGIGSDRADVTEKLGKPSYDGEYIDAVKQIAYKDKGLSLMLFQDRVCEMLIGK